MKIRTLPGRAKNRGASSGRSFVRFSFALAVSTVLIMTTMVAEGAKSSHSKTSGKLIEAWLESGKTAEKAGELEKAVVLYNEILRQSPTHKGAQRALRGLRGQGVDINVKKDANPAALIALEAARIAVGGDPVGIAKAKMANGDYAEAQAILQAALSQDLDRGVRKDVEKLLAEIKADRERSAERRMKLRGATTSDELGQLLKRAEILLEGEEVEEAERVLREADRLAPGHPGVDALLSRSALLRANLAQRSADAESAMEVTRRAEMQLKARDVYLEGQKRYLEGDVIGAVKAWQRALDIDAEHAQSQEMIQNTKAIHSAALAREADQREEIAQDAEFEVKLDTEIVEYSTENDLDVNDVLKILNTLSGLDFVKDDSVQGKVWFSVRDKSVREVLDLISKEYGYAWSRDGNTVRVEADLATQVYPLDEVQYQTIATILREASTLEDSSLDLRKLLYGESGQPQVPGKALYLQERTRSLVVVDSREKQTVVKSFLDKLPPLANEYTPTETKIYHLRERDAKQIHDQVKLLLYGEEGAYDPSSRRKIFLDSLSNTMIVIDYPENIKKVEALLSDEQFNRAIEEGEIRSRRFQVADVEDIEDDPDAIERRRSFLDGIKEIVEIMLYGSGTREAAVQQGRRIRVDVDRGTIDIVDTPDNIQKVADYLSSVRGDTMEDVFIEVFNIQHVPVMEIIDALNILFYDATTSVRSLFIDLESVQTLSAGDEQGTETEISGTFEESSRELMNLQSSGGGQDFQQFFSVKFYPDVNTNRLIVYSFETESIDLTKRILQAFDRPHRMVELEARFVSVSLSDLTSIGLDYSIGEPLKGDFDFDSGISELGMIGDDNIPSRSVNFNYDTLSESQFSFVMNLIDTLETSNVLSAPRVTTIPGLNTQAMLFVGTQEPYISDVTLDDGGDDDPTNNRLTYEFENAMVGIRLAFIPFILNDNHLYLEIAPIITDIVGRVPVQLDDSGGGSGGGFDPAALAALGQPIFSQKLVNSSVRIRNGDTLVLGGLISDAVSEQRNDVPLLSKIPFLGAMFSDVSYNVTKESTMIFVTVRIIEPETY